MSSGRIASDDGAVGGYSSEASRPLSTIYANPDPLLVSRQGLFPGLVQLPDGDIVALFSIGQAFDAADMRSFVSRSTDDGPHLVAAGAAARPRR